MNTLAVLSDLSFTHLSSLAMSNDGSGTIRQQDMGKILSYLNDGLTQIFGEFAVKEKVMQIQLFEHITNYHLVSRFARSQQPQPNVDFPYILDHNRAPFKGDVNKVTAVWDNMGRNRVINDENNLRSVFIMAPDLLTVPYPEKDIILFVHYEAKPQRITMDNLDEEIDLPTSLFPALKAYIAAQVFMGIGSNDSVRISQGYENQYVSIIRMLKSSDALTESKFTARPFEERGWI